MIPPEEMTATAGQLADALTAAAAIMPPDEASESAGPVPGGQARPAAGTVRRRMGRLRTWLIPVAAAASVTAIILTAVALTSGPTPAPAPGTNSPQAPASAGRNINPPAGAPPFYVTIASRGITKQGRQLVTVQVRRTSDGQVTGTVPGMSALLAGLNLDWGISGTADDRTFVLAASQLEGCGGPAPPAPVQTRFYRFSLTSTGQVTGLRMVGRIVTGDVVTEFAVSPDGTKIAYAEQGCDGSASAAADGGAIHIMDLASRSVRSWQNTVTAATPARVTTQIGALSWTADGRTLAVSYRWVPDEGSPDLAVLALDATSSGGSLQAHSHLLLSQSTRCTVCIFTAVVSPGGSTLTTVAETAVKPLPSEPGNPWHRLLVLQISVATGKPGGTLYRSAPEVGTYDGLVPVLSADGDRQHWFLWNDPEGFGWLSGGKQLPVPAERGAGVMAIGW